VVFFGRTTNIFANTFARVFGFARPIGAGVFRGVFRRYLQRLPVITLQPGSVFATVRYYFDLLMFFAVCLLNI
jgi:hypothetical protein